jgi:hypothetical protein
MQVHVTQGQQPAPVVVLSDPIIPAVRGEFYSYSTQFTTERPLGYLMKCRANKGRQITDDENYAHEHDLTFIFGNGAIGVCSPDSAPSIALLKDITLSQPLNRTWITIASLDGDVFRSLRQQKNGHALARACRASASTSFAGISLCPGMILDVLTQSGKYGLLLVKELTPTSVSVDACHILL